MKVYSRRITLLYSVNNITAQPTADGSVTVHFGGCEEGRVNSLPIMEGWNYAAGLNNLRKGVLEGKYQFPRPKPSRGFLFSHIIFIYNANLLTLFIRLFFAYFSFCCVLLPFFRLIFRLNYDFAKILFFFLHPVGISPISPWQTAEETRSFV